MVFLSYKFFDFQFMRYLAFLVSLAGFSGSFDPQSITELNPDEFEFHANEHEGLQWGNATAEPWIMNSTAAPPITAVLYNSVGHT
jgi:hypothetical protein